MNKKENKPHRLNDTFRLGDTGALCRGGRNFIKSYEENGDNSIKVKVLNWTDLKKYLDSQDDSILKETYIDKKYYKAEQCLKKGDLVFTTFPTMAGQNVLYVSETLEDLFYNETMYIYRTTEDIDSEYIYCMLNCGIFDKVIQQYGVGYKLKLKHSMILDIELPLYDKVTQRKIVEEYRNIKNLEKELKERKDNYNEQLFRKIKSSILM